MTVLCSSDSTVCTLRVEFLIIFSFYFWLGWAFIAVHGLSLAAVSSGYSLVAVHGLTCSEARGIFPDQGLKPRPMHWQAGS